MWKTLTLPTLGGYVDEGLGEGRAGERCGWEGQGRRVRQGMSPEGSGREWCPEGSREGGLMGHRWGGRRLLFPRLLPRRLCSCRAPSCPPSASPAGHHGAASAQPAPEHHSAPVMTPLGVILFPELCPAPSRSPQPSPPSLPLPGHLQNRAEKVRLPPHLPPDFKCRAGVCPPASLACAHPTCSRIGPSTVWLLFFWQQFFFSPTSLRFVTEVNKNVHSQDLRAYVHYNVSRLALPVPTGSRRPSAVPTLSFYYSAGIAY